MKTTYCFCLGLLLACSPALWAQQWTIHTLRSDIVGAWTRAGDIDKDQDPDILVQSGDSVYWYENLRPGWAPHLVDPTFYKSAFSYVDLVDVDGDGDLDVVKGTSLGTDHDTLTWNENQSKGSIWVKHVLTPLHEALGWMQGAYGDIDRDGDPDMVVPEFDLGSQPTQGRLFWLENPGTPDNWIKHTVLSGNYNFASVADLDGDGDLDIVAGFNGVYWLENRLPDPNWIKHTLVNATGQAYLFGLCADMNGDHGIDIVASDAATSSIQLFTNPIWQKINVHNTGKNIFLGVAGDLDGDGDNDVTYGGAGFEAQALGWAENTTFGTKWTLHDITPSLKIQMIPTGLADVDGDSDIDIISLMFNPSTGIGSAFWAENPRFSTGLSAIPEPPVRLAVWPNPTPGGAAVQFELQRTDMVRVTICDKLGRNIRLVDVATMEPGQHVVEWDGCAENGISVPAGVYWIRVETANRVAGVALIKL